MNIKTGVMVAAVGTALSGEAAVPSPVSVLSCATVVMTLGAATVKVLPDCTIATFAPFANDTSPVNPFKLLTTRLGKNAVVCKVPSGN